MDYRLMSVFSRMLQFENPKNMSEVSLSFLESLLTELDDNMTEVERIVNALTAARDCNRKTDKVVLNIIP